MVLDGPGCKFNWREPFKTRMRSFQIVIAPPCFDDVASMSEASEQRFVQTLIAQLPVKALDEAVLHWLAWLNVMPFNFSFLLPRQDDVRSEFRAVVADHHERVTAPFSNAIKFARDPTAGQRVINYTRQAFARKVVDHVENAEPATLV